MYSVSITVDNVIDALADFLQPFVGTAEIVRAQANRVPMPQGPCVVLTEWPRPAPSVSTFKLTFTARPLAIGAGR